MSRVRAASLSAALAWTLLGCSRGELLVEGPVRLGPSASVVTFERPVRVPVGAWELCFEFDRPGDSRSASGIEAVLLGVDGARTTFVESTLDRRGDAWVCRVGALGVSTGATIEVAAAELRSEVPLTIRGIRAPVGAGSRP